MTAEHHLTTPTITPPAPVLSSSGAGNKASSSPVVDDVSPHKSTLTAIKLESSSDCNGNAISHTHGGASGPRNDTDDNSYVFVNSNDDSSLPLSLEGNDDNSDRNEEHPDADPQESPKDLPNGTPVTTETQVAASSIINHDSLDKADDMDAPNQTNQNSLNEAHDTDPLPAATQVIHQNGTVEVSSPIQLGHQQIESESSPASGQDHQDSEGTASGLELDVDLADGPLPDLASSLDATKSADVCNKAQEDSLVSISSLGSIQSEPADVIQSTFANQQNPNSVDEFVGLQESKSACSDATCSHPQHIEVRFDTEPVPLVEGTVKFAGPTVMEQLESPQSDMSEQRIEEEMKGELLPEAKQNQQTIVEIGENALSNLDQGSDAERSVREVDLISSTATATDTVLNHNEGHSPVPSFSDSVRDTKESTEYADKSEKSLELDKSSSHNDTLVPTPSCLRKENEAEGKPIENVQESTGEDKFQQGASPLTNDNVEEFCDPGIENSINDAVQSLEKLPDIPGEHEIELQASLPTESPAVNTDGVIEPENDLVNTVPGITSPVSIERSGILLSEDVNDHDLGESKHRCSADSAIARTEFDICTADSGEMVSSFQVDDAHDITKVGIQDVECANMHSVPSHAEIKREVESGIDSQDRLSNSTLGSKIEVSDSSSASDENVPNSVPEIKDDKYQGDQLSVSDIQSNDKLKGQESENIEKSLANEASMSSPENSVADALAGQGVAVGLLTRPFQFLIRMPRFDDLKVREQIKHAQLQVDEKTKIRDACRLEIQKLKANCHGCAADCATAVSNARSAKKSVKSKRAEIDSLQVVLNKVKNAISVDDIDARIYNMEHMIQHETLPLKEEKQFIREIKQLKQLREQLSSNIGSQDEVQQAFNKREEIEERLKSLKKELDHLKDGVLKAEAVAQATQKRYEDENQKLRELISQFEEANDIRQSAYHHLQSLKKELFEKNKQFRIYKDNAAAASDFAASGDREALRHLCHNQVETIMDLWNKDDEFRKEYVKCNVRSTVRRLGTLDGRSLGPDEEPPVLTSYGIERPDRLVSNQPNIRSLLLTPILKQEDQTKPVEDVLADDTDKVKEGEAKSQTAKNGEVVQYTLGNGPTTVSGRGLNDEISETEYIPTKEELELARKAEELRKEEAAAKLREQRRLEEKSKALEALERKKRNAEKAQIRAELRAQKEAEQKEKEREKRLRKKERKKASGAEIPEGNNFGESTPSSEVVTETIQEPETRDTFASATKRPQKPSVITKQSKTKSIPPPLRNRSKRKMQQWMWVIITCMLVIFLFVLGNVGFFSNLSNIRQRSYSP